MTQKIRQKHFEIKLNELEALKQKLLALAEDTTTPTLREHLLGSASQVDEAIVLLYMNHL